MPDSIAFSRFDECGAAFRDRSLGRADTPSHRAVPLMFMNGEEHRGYRSVLRRAQAGLIQHVRPSLEEFAVESLARVIGDERSSFDFVEEFVSPFVSSVTRGIMGVPHERWVLFRAAMHDDGPPIQGADFLPARMDRLTGLFRSLHADGGISAGSLSSRVFEEAEAAGLGACEAAKVCAALLVGALETTELLLGTVSWVFLSRSAVERGCSDSDLGLFFDEVARLFPPVQLVGRDALADTAICHLPVRKGTIVRLDIRAANRDISHFERGSAFGPERAAHGEAGGPGLAFGAGPHACPGAALAASEGLAMLRAISTKGSALHAVGDPTFVDGPILSGVVAFVCRRSR